MADISLGAQRIWRVSAVGGYCPPALIQKPSIKTGFSQGAARGGDAQGDAVIEKMSCIAND